MIRPSPVAVGCAAETSGTPSSSSNSSLSFAKPPVARITCVGLDLDVLAAVQDEHAAHAQRVVVGGDAAR